MGHATDLDLDGLRRSLVGVAVPGDAAPMARYMKNHFRFLGVKTPARRAASRPIVRAARSAPVDDVVAFVRSCWEPPEREFQYVGADALAAAAPRLSARHLNAVESLIVTKSWWDTVDPLATATVGEIVRNHPAAVTCTDDWIARDDVWLARSAIIHQLGSGASTDADRLFAYCFRRSDDTDFFIRKAIGWALRQYARTDPQAVIAFVGAHEADLSALSRREALKQL